MKINRIFFSATFYFFITIALAFGVDNNTTRRFGIFIGSNLGGRDRVTLRYAVNDARSISGVFSDMGGIASEDLVLLIDPSVSEINRRLSTLREQVILANRTNYRTEIIFYYSGHSDEDGLLLNRERYNYRELKDRINDIPSVMRIVILDSCASGAFTRLKGGDKTQPFLMDNSLTAEGFAFLTSSSADESSQESDRIAASYFTHALVAGLRGAADSVGDGRVTLNELYRYAYSETLARTETSLYGAQHPSYDIQISGSGDLVLTDVKETSAGIVFDENLTGRLSIRNSQDHLIAEINKTAVRPLELGLEPGLYRITLQQSGGLFQAEVTLIEGRRVLVTMQNFSPISADPAQRRGAGDAANDTALYSFFLNIAPNEYNIPLIGFVNIARGNHSIAQIGFVNWNHGNFSGLQAGFVNTVGGSFNGAQFAFVNTNVGETKGAQFAFVNTAVKPITGAQFGFVNVAAQGIKGPQFGFVNYADSIENGVPIGFISVVRNGGYYAVEYSFSEFYTYNVGFKIGVDRFYSTLFVSYNQTNEASWDNFAIGFGIGSLLPIGKLFFFNPEYIALSSPIVDDLSLGFYNSGNRNLQTLVTYFGVNLGKLSFTLGPSVTFIQIAENASQPEPLFSLYSYDFDQRNRIVIGARAAVRWRLN